MILPDLLLESRVNRHWNESGIDSYQHCIDPEHFKNYPYNVTYDYNGRGFRDREWPSSLHDLKNSVWCFGDSFTVGIGSPVAHTWTHLLEQSLGKRTINVSMDGASNEWIARKIVDVVDTVNPDLIVVMWSYFQRRELNNPTLSDEQRRLSVTEDSLVDEHADFINFKTCVSKIENLPTRCIHFIIPDAAPFLTTEGIYSSIQKIWNDIRAPLWSTESPGTLEEYKQLPEFIQSEIKTLHKCEDTLIRLLTRIDNSVEDQIKHLIRYYGGVVPILDWARDKHHFDLKSSQWVTSRVLSILGQ